VSKPRSAAARQQAEAPAGRFSMTRTALCAVLVAAGIAYVAYYLAAVVDDGTPKAIADLGDWNYLIGFGVLFLGLVLAAHPGTPLGQGRGVVVGMLGSFLIGLVWIVVYYMTSQSANVPVIQDLGNYNLLVGIGFMAVGFVYATRWE
jgi:hypothetical protein